MKKLRRIFALIGAILLALLYVSALVSSFFDNELSLNLLKASIAGTILIPVLLYGITIFVKLSKNDTEDDPKE